MLIADIIIGERVRKDVGDLKGLAASIEKHGLLHPIVVKSDGTLVAGFRRLEAFRLLSRKEIPASVIDVADMLSAERDENTERKDFTPTEAVAVGALVEARHLEKVKAQQHAFKSAAGAKGHGINKDVKEIPVGRTAAAASKAVGMSESNYLRARGVVAAAHNDPETFGDLPAQMDETGNVHAAHEEMGRRIRGEKKRHAVLHGMRHANSSTEIQKAIPLLGGVIEVLKRIDPLKVDAEHRAEWGQAIRSAGYSLELIGRKMIDGKR